jgi:FixJ family two-component response regulator
MLDITYSTCLGSVHDTRPVSPAVDPLADLTHREREAAQFVAEGLTNKKIAKRMGVSFHTAKFHDCLIACRGDLFKASVMWCKVRGWTSTARVEWYTAWQTTDLPREVNAAVEEYRLRE